MSILLSELTNNMDVLRTRPDAFAAGVAYSLDMPRAINHIKQLEAENARLHKDVEAARRVEKCWEMTKRAGGIHIKLTRCEDRKKGVPPAFEVEFPSYYDNCEGSDFPTPEHATLAWFKRT